MPYVKKNGEWVEIDYLLRKSDDWVLPSDAFVKWGGTWTSLMSLIDTERCMINQEGLVVNAFHNVLGRDGYFPQEAGTSEGQLILIKAMALCYQSTGEQIYLDHLDNIIRPLDKMFRKDLASISNEFLTPHWLFMVKSYTEGQSANLEYTIELTEDDGMYRGVIPASDGGEVVIDIPRMFSTDSYLLWDNPFSAVVGTEYTNFEFFTNEDGLCEIAIHYTDLGISDDGGMPDFEVNLVLILNQGDVMGRSQLIEAWPYWRLLEDGEVNCATDTLPWAWEAFHLLEQVYDDDQYANLRESIEDTMLEVYKVDDGRNWIKPYFSDNPFSLSGTYLSTQRYSMDESDISRDDKFNVVINIPYVALGRSTEMQFGRGLSDEIKDTDTHLLVNVTPNSTGSTSGVYIYAFIQDTNDINTAVRWQARIDLTIGEEMSVEIPISSFNPYVYDGDSWNVSNDSSLSIVGDISVVGLVYTLNSELNITLESIRPLPEVSLPYTTGAAPFTVNSFNDVVIDWRGGPGVGYQDMNTWSNFSQPEYYENMKQFLTDSQDEYESRYGVRGPFLPAYVWDRSDLDSVDAPVDTWTFEWSDPNTEWGGYTARVIAGAAEAGNREDDETTLDIASDFIVWMDSVWTDVDKYIITNLPETLDEITTGVYYDEGDIVQFNSKVFKCNSYGMIPEETEIPEDPGFNVGDTMVISDIEFTCIGYAYGSCPAYGSYDDPHMAALILRACCYLYQSGRETIASLSLAKKCWDYLDRLWLDANGIVDDTWSNNPEDGEWFGFWSGEILIIHSLLLSNFSSMITELGTSVSEIEGRMYDHAEWIKTYTR